MTDDEALEICLRCKRPDGKVEIGDFAREIERQVLERAIKAIETVRAPICDPARPIRELIEQSASKEKQG